MLPVAVAVEELPPPPPPPHDVTRIVNNSNVTLSTMNLEEFLKPQQYCSN